MDREVRALNSQSASGSFWRLNTRRISPPRGFLQAHDQNNERSSRRTERHSRGPSSTGRAIAERDLAGSRPGQRHTLKSSVHLENGLLWAPVNLVIPARIVRPTNNQVTGTVMLDDQLAVGLGYHIRCPSRSAQFNSNGSRHHVLGRRILQMVPWPGLGGSFAMNEPSFVRPISHCQCGED